MNPRPLNPLIVPLVVAVLLVFGLAGTSIWFNSKYRSASTDLQNQIDAAVQSAKAQQKTELEEEFAEASKSPHKAYTAPVELSSIGVTYPKTWSSYVVEKSGTGTVLDGYFHPGTVPAVNGKTPFALRVTLETKAYAKEVAGYDGEVDKGVLKAKAVSILGVQGVRLDGQIDKGINGAIVLLPLRDKTLKIWTENTDYLKDYNDTILAFFTFSP